MKNSLLGTTLFVSSLLFAAPALAQTDADFNGDGKADVVIRNYTTGANALWAMNGTTMSSIIDLPALPDVNYHFGGAADFNGDGQTDLVVRNMSTGTNAIWLMTGTTLSSIVDLPGLTQGNPALWNIIGVSDFTGDGKPDILWQSGTISHYIWVMNGTSWVSSTYVDVPACGGTTTRNVTGYVAGDLTGDGQPDIVARDTTDGHNLVIPMLGVNPQCGIALPQLPANYVFAGIGDYTGDLKNDLLVRNTVTGADAIWAMDGTTYVTTVDLPYLAAPTFAIDGPK